MIENVPHYISIVFGLTTVITLLLFIWTIKSSASEHTKKKSTAVFLGLVIWMIIQVVLPLNNVYSADIHSFPPKIMLLGILPPMVTIILLFVTGKGREFIDGLPLKNLTYTNTVRIPVELVLFLLFLDKAVPGLMTFEGRNFDILAGITAPFIAYLCFMKNKLERNVLLVWNIISLALLVNIVVNALFSAPSPIQKFAFDQPNIAILYFPFSWLPTLIVPIVLLGHLTSIRQLLKRKTVE